MMRQRAFGIVGLAVVCLYFGLAVAGAEARFGSLEGHVTIQGDNIPLSNVTIEVMGFGEARTDQNGKYVFDHLPAGSYKVRINDSMYDQYRRTVMIRANRTTVSNFSILPLSAPRQRPDNSRLRVEQTNVNTNEVSKVLATGSVKGQLFYEPTRPEWSKRPAKSSWTVKVGQSSATPDERGDYTITGLLPGTYKVTLEGGSRCYVPDPRNKKSVKIRVGQTLTLDLSIFARC